MNHPTRIAVVLALMCLTPVKGHSADAAYDITVVADRTKANGSPWDGVPRLGNAKINLNAAPDIAVCIVKANAKPDCLWRPNGRRLLSICQNAWTCTFPNVALQELPVGLIFIDIDARNHDIIDTVVLTGNENADANAEIAESLRAAMSILTPHRSEDSKEHQVRDAKILPFKDCVSGKPCRLSQSEFKIERVK